MDSFVLTLSHTSAHICTHTEENRQASALLNTRRIGHDTFEYFIQMSKQFLTYPHENTPHTLAPIRISRMTVFGSGMISIKYER